MYEITDTTKINNIVIMKRSEKLKIFEILIFGKQLNKTDIKYTITTNMLIGLKKQFNEIVGTTNDKKSNIVANDLMLFILFCINDDIKKIPNAEIRNSRAENCLLKPT